MATPTSQRVALMSIHPIYARAILDGTKTVEFRKARLATDITTVLIYATAPTAAVIGAFTIDGQDTNHPHLLWERFARVAGIDETAFFAYYADRPVGTGIRIRNVISAAKPIPLRDLGVTRPPQSYQYLDAERVAEVFEQLQDPRGLRLTG